MKGVLTHVTVNGSITPLPHPRKAADWALTKTRCSVGVMQIMFSGEKYETYKVQATHKKHPKREKLYVPGGCKPCIRPCPPFCRFHPRQLLQSSGSLPQEQSESSSNRSLSSNENLSPSYSHSNIKSMMFGGTSEIQQGQTRHFFRFGSAFRWTDCLPLRNIEWQKMICFPFSNNTKWPKYVPHSLI